jgi:thiol-disulfide isomerase/thioredoxin
MEPADPDQDKNFIDVSTYELPNGRTMISYTSTWCAPCQRIKPHLEALKEQKAIVHWTKRRIHVTDRRPGMKIPTFDFMSMDDSVIIESIQTSDSAKLDDLLRKYSAIPETEEGSSAA